MRPRKYPLDPLARLRAKNVDRAARVLSAAVHAREHAELVESEARARQEAAEKASRDVTRGEQTALERGGLRSVDLARAAAWAVRADADRKALEAGVVRAADATSSAQGGETSARGEMARAQADAEVVERDRTKWADGVAKRDEAAEEEAAAEALRGGAGGKVRGR